LFNGGEEIPIPKSFKEATEEIIETNDNIQDFIDVKLTITTNGKADRIGKNEMIEIYKEMYPNRGMNHQILKSSLVERGIDWDKEIRGEDGIKGCYYNVIRKNENNNEDNNNYKFGKSPFDYGIESDDLNIVKLKNENSELKNKLKELEAQILLLQLQLPKKEEIKQVQINDDDIKALEKELNDVCNSIKPKQKEPKPESEQENKFDNNDINDILDFIESSTNTKKSKKSKK
jgi:hypothetical protein